MKPVRAFERDEGVNQRTDERMNERTAGLFSDIQFVKGVGPQRAMGFAKLGIKTVYDLLTAYPKKHYDRGAVRKMGTVRMGEDVTIQGRVAYVRDYKSPRMGMRIFSVDLSDDTGRISAVWFGQSHLRRIIHVGDLLIVAGRIDYYGTLQIRVADFEIVSGEDAPAIHTSGLVPSYGPVDEVGRKYYRRVVWTVVQDLTPGLPDPLPSELRRQRGFLSLGESFRAYHFPRTVQEKERARRRLAYDEFFYLQLVLAQRRRDVQQLPVARPLKIGPVLDGRIRALFPFTLTRAQERVIGEIRKDLVSSRPMNRLLQGDVGSGKTIVAAYAVLACVGNRYQAAVMAPTEILAEQHARTFGRMLEHSRVRIGFLSGSRRKGRKDLLKKIAEGEIDLVIGTHAVVQEDVRFKSLALAVIDEQQKFGVMQRAALRLKGERPHVLVMTATPIPRTLSLTLFGDLDVSVIDEMPPGRKPARTLYEAGGKRAQAMEFVRSKLREGRQAYFVYPLIEKSAKLDLQSAIEAHQRLVSEFPGYTVALLHGRMKDEEKEAVMEEFRAGRAHVLVSTIVVEVGIDVPNATVMVIDHCERYGLSQLHQLRGRIGRGSYDATCVLFGGLKSEVSRERIRVFTSTTDGFKIAEADLRLRGPGEMFGTRQSGLPEFKAANLVGDAQLLGWARQDAFAMVGRDPALSPLVRELLGRRYENKAPIVSVG
ncbi:MAG: ATP-dependent DNA helicase RecG [Planctomycetes bacterium]|nr:ATP-dependent DNA helicase RecG [Planctomycetota bacterium]